MVQSNDAKTSAGITIPSWFAATLLASLFGGLLSLGGYMVAWNRDDLAFKREVLTRLANVERAVGDSVIQRTQERVNNIERKLDRHIEWAETEERDYDTKLNSLERRMSEPRK
jgi:hypothetical protein